MKLLSLPYCESNAYRNMAIDQWLLELAIEEQSLIFRHYAWENPAITFGYTQNFREIDARANYKGLERCRRPTGGGIVDHRGDFTYALVLPNSYELTRKKPLELYEWLHGIWVDIFRNLGVPSELYDPDKCGQGGCLTCFEAPSPHDVVLKNTATKLAGAAMKRTREGILFQGSIWKPHIPEVGDERMHQTFLDVFCRSAGVEPHRFYTDYSDAFISVRETAFRESSWNTRR